MVSIPTIGTCPRGGGRRVRARPCEPWAAGAPNPNGTLYRGGRSGSLLQRGEAVKVASASVGDIAFYGPSRSDIGYVTVYVGNGRCVSHGQESGPMLYPLDYDRGSAGRLQLVKTYLS